MRLEAYQLLLEINEGKKYSNIAIRDFLKGSQLSRIDQDLLTKIVYGTIQNQMYLEYQLSFLVKKMPKPKIKWLLLMSLYQMIYLDKVPDYAIVDQAVKVMKKIDNHQSAFINGVLRQFIKQGIQQLPTDPIKALSIETSHPLWLIGMWNKHYGLDVTRAICTSNQEVPKLAARVNTLKTSRDDLINENCMPSEVSKDGVIYMQGNIAELEDFKEGKVTIQDESSQLVSLLLNPALNSSVLDMCSAPGTKTTHIAQLMKNTGEVYAIDLHQHKIPLISLQAERLGITTIKAMQGDSTKLNDIIGDKQFDYVLLDGPCSGFGVFRRKPEIKYKEVDMDGLIKIQYELLESAKHLIKDNGYLVYSTCTLNKKENELQISEFLKRNKTFELIEERTIFPFEFGSDGFYMAKLLKRGS